MSGGCLFDADGFYYGPIVAGCNDSRGDGFSAVYPVFDTSIDGNQEVFPKDLSIKSELLLPYWIIEGRSHFISYLHYLFTS